MNWTRYPRWRRRCGSTTLTNQRSSISETLTALQPRWCFLACTAVPRRKARLGHWSEEHVHIELLHHFWTSCVRECHQKLQPLLEYVSQSGYDIILQVLEEAHRFLMNWFDSFLYKQTLRTLDTIYEYSAELPTWTMESERTLNRVAKLSNQETQNMYTISLHTSWASQSYSTRLFGPSDHCGWTL